MKGIMLLTAGMSGSLVHVLVSDEKSVLSVSAVMEPVVILASAANAFSSLIASLWLIKVMSSSHKMDRSITAEG